MPEKGAPAPPIFRGLKGGLEWGLLGGLERGAAAGALGHVFAGSAGGADSFCIAGEVDDAVFVVADGVYDLDHACGSEAALAGWAGSGHAEGSVVADACYPDGGAGS